MKTLFKATIITACIFIFLGIGLSIVAYVLGGRIVGNVRYFNTGNFEQEYVNVYSLDFDFAACDVKIRTGTDDKFKIKAENIPLEMFESKVKNGTWSIELKETKRRWKRFLGVNIHSDMNIEITLPKNHSLEEVTINGGAASIEVDMLHAGNVEINIGAGSIKIHKLSASKLKSTTGVGDTKIDGYISGNVDIDCSVGSVELELDNELKDFNYHVNVSLGSVEIEGLNLSNSPTHNISHDAYYDMNIDCSVGSVTIKFD